MEYLNEEEQNELLRVQKESVDNHNKANNIDTLAKSISQKQAQDYRKDLKSICIEKATCNYLKSKLAINLILNFEMGLSFSCKLDQDFYIISNC